jgi:molybdopterin synthase catalytic subunit
MGLVSASAPQSPQPAWWSEDVWVALTTDPLSLEQAAAWVTRADCGAVVVFAGTVRDHAAGRPGVVELEYEAYAAHVEPRLAAIAAEARARWESLGRLALWHRTGTLTVSECSVVVAVSAAHRGEAFDAARFCIDTLKATVPIWKRERWAHGEDWGQDAHEIMEIRS